MPEFVKPTAEEVLDRSPDGLGNYYDYSGETLEQDKDTEGVFVDFIVSLNSNIDEIISLYSKFASPLVKDGDSIISGFEGNEREEITQKLRDELSDYPEKLLEAAAWGFDSVLDQDETGSVLVNYSGLDTVLRGLDTSLDQLNRVARLIDKPAEERADGEQSVYTDVYAELIEMRVELLNRLYDFGEEEGEEPPKLWKHINPVSLTKLMKLEFRDGSITYNAKVFDVFKKFDLSGTPQLEGAGQDYMNVLVAAAELATVDYRNHFIERGETIKNLAEHFGFDEKQMHECMKAWALTTKTSKGRDAEGNPQYIETEDEINEAVTEHIFSNLASMQAIANKIDSYVWTERDSIGEEDDISLLRLYRQFGIRVFSRYTFDDIIGQLHAYSPDEQPTLVVSALSDHNGAINKVSKDIAGVEIEKPVYTEAKNVQELLKALRLTSRTYGALKDVIINAHGASDGKSLELGRHVNQKYGELTAEQIDSIVTHKLVSEGRLDPNGSVTFLVCSAGEKDGLANTLARQLNNEGVRIIAADDIVYGLTRNVDGELGLKDEDGNTNISLEYQRGYSRRLR